MDKICHGCFPENADGTNRFIAAGEKCIVPTNKCSWEELCEIVKHGVKTRSRAYTEPIVDYKSLSENNGLIGGSLEKNKRTIDFVIVVGNLRCYTCC